MKNTQKSNQEKRTSGSSNERKNGSSPAGRSTQRTNSDSRSAGRNEKPSSKNKNQ